MQKLRFLIPRALVLQEHITKCVMTGEPLSDNVTYLGTKLFYDLLGLSETVDKLYEEITNPGSYKPPQHLDPISGAGDILASEK